MYGPWRYGSSASITEDPVAADQNLYRSSFYGARVAHAFEARAARQARRKWFTEFWKISLTNGSVPAQYNWTHGTRFKNVFFPILLLITTSLLLLYAILAGLLRIASGTETLMIASSLGTLTTFLLYFLSSLLHVLRWKLSKEENYSRLVSLCATVLYSISCLALFCGEIMSEDSMLDHSLRLVYFITLYLLISYDSSLALIESITLLFLVTVSAVVGRLVASCVWSTPYFVIENATFTLVTIVSFALSTTILLFRNWVLVRTYSEASEVSILREEMAVSTELATQMTASIFPEVMHNSILVGRYYWGSKEVVCGMLVEVVGYKYWRSGDSFLLYKLFRKLERLFVLFDDLLTGHPFKKCCNHGARYYVAAISSGSRTSRLEMTETVLQMIGIGEQFLRALGEFNALERQRKTSQEDVGYGELSLRICIHVGKAEVFNLASGHPSFHLSGPCIAGLESMAERSYVNQIFISAAAHVRVSDRVKVQRISSLGTNAEQIGRVFPLFMYDIGVGVMNMVDLHPSIGHLPSVGSERSSSPIVCSTRSRVSSVRVTGSQRSSFSGTRPSSVTLEGNAMTYHRFTHRRGYLPRDSTERKDSQISLGSLNSLALNMIESKERGRKRKSNATLPNSSLIHFSQNDGTERNCSSRWRLSRMEAYTVIFPCLTAALMLANNAVRNMVLYVTFGMVGEVGIVAFWVNVIVRLFLASWLLFWGAVTLVVPRMLSPSTFFVAMHLPALVTMAILPASATPTNPFLFFVIFSILTSLCLAMSHAMVYVALLHYVVMLVVGSLFWLEFHTEIFGVFALLPSVIYVSFDFHRNFSKLRKGILLAQCVGNVAHQHLAQNASMLGLELPSYFKTDLENLKHPMYCIFEKSPILFVQLQGRITRVESEECVAELDLLLDMFSNSAKNHHCHIARLGPSSAYSITVIPLHQNLTKISLRQPSSASDELQSNQDQFCSDTLNLYEFLKEIQYCCALLPIKAVRLRAGLSVGDFLYGLVGSEITSFDLLGTAVLTAEIQCASACDSQLVACDEALAVLPEDLQSSLQKTVVVGERGALDEVVDEEAVRAEGEGYNRVTIPVERTLQLSSEVEVRLEALKVGLARYEGKTKKRAYNLLPLYELESDGFSAVGESEVKKS
jgi:class 3 adenylate cyclase